MPTPPLGWAAAGSMLHAHGGLMEVANGHVRGDLGYIWFEPNLPRQNVGMIIFFCTYRCLDCSKCIVHFFGKYTFIVWFATMRV